MIFLALNSDTAPILKLPAPRHSGKIIICKKKKKSQYQGHLLDSGLIHWFACLKGLDLLYNCSVGRVESKWPLVAPITTFTRLKTFRLPNRLLIHQYHNLFTKKLTLKLLLCFYMTFTTATGHFFRRPNYLDQNLSSDSLFQHTSESIFWLYAIYYVIFQIIFIR